MTEFDMSPADLSLESREKRPGPYQRDGMSPKLTIFAKSVLTERNAAGPT